MKKNSKVAEFISAQVANQINSISDAKSKTSNKKAKGTSAKKSSKKNTAKVVETPAAKKENTIKEVAKQQKASIAEKVISTRDVKYLYPADVVDQLARKKWRQETRNKYRALEREVHKFQDQNSKEAKAAIKEFEEFKKQVLKPNQVI